MSGDGNWFVGPELVFPSREMKVLAAEAGRIGVKVV